MTDFDKRLGAQIAQLRTEEGMGQTKFAALVREHGPLFHQATVYKVEFGLRPVRASELAPIADVLGVDSSGLLGLIRGDLEDLKALAESRKRRRIAALRAELAALEGGED